MSLRSSGFVPRLLRGWTVLVIAVLLAACGTSSPAASSAASVEAEPSTAASPSEGAESSDSAAPSAAASEAPAAEICLPSEVLAAIGEIADGNLEPEVALEEIADAVEALDVTELEREVPFAAQDRDDLVKNLREADPNPTQLEFAADVFRSELFDLVGPCESDGSAADCLNADVVAALDELDSGNLDTDPAPAEVADALDALELDGPAAEARDNTVATLRESPLDEGGVVMSLQMLYSQVALPEC
jgi:hypothetical protein